MQTMKKECGPISDLSAVPKLTAAKGSSLQAELNMRPQNIRAGMSTIISDLQTSALLLLNSSWKAKELETNLVLSFHQKWDING